MALYIDPPRWPAHGTVFSHLVSDSSYEELHACAARIGLSRKAFDLDHYDVPEELYPAALDAGAFPVDGARLVQVLRGSGLRVPARERPEKVIPALRRRWCKIGIEDPAVGESLLAQWNERHRHYHTPVHLLECLTALEQLSPRITGQAPSPEVQLAAWFHDAVYDGRAGEDEQRSADFAHKTLGGGLGEEVARLVLLTREHKVEPHDTRGALFVDADLSILAAPRPRYRRYASQVRREYAHVNDEQWRMGRLTVLREFATRNRLFISAWAHTEWTSHARGNLAWEMDALKGRSETLH